MNGPEYGLPPDLEIEPGEVLLLAAPEVWHFPLDRWRNIWDRFGGEGERIAILDTGVNAHQCLPTPVSERSFVGGGSARDGHGHGTHCAGTALGRSGIGAACRAELLNGKVLTDGGSGNSGGIAAGIRWAVDEGATIISMSLGGGGAHDPTRQAIEYANKNGVLCVASAGNSGQRLPNNTIGHPARYLECGCSGAKDRNGNIASFSSAGREMDIVTPGAQIVSSSNTNPNGWKTMSGTSMSCPYLAGLCAVVRSGMAKAGMVRLGGIDDWRPWWAKFAIDKGPEGRDPVWGVGIPDYERIVTFLSQPEIKWV